MRSRLEADNFLTVWFGAWNYEGEGPLLPLLIRALWRAAPPHLTKSREAKKRWRRLSDFSKKVAKKSPELALLAGAIGLHWHFLHLAVPFVEHSKGSAEDDSDAVEAVHKEFTWLISELSEEHSGLPIVFFIDDLDRCNPVAALNLIESLRILIGGNEASSASVPNARYVVAVDHSALLRAISQKFAGLSGSDGNRYLEKIFPLSFHLPQPEGADIHNFVQSFLEPTDSDSAVQIGDDDKDALGLAMADPLFANPRLMRRCIERFRMVLEFEAGCNDRSTSHLLDPQYEQLFLARWIAAIERWPSLRRTFLRRSDDYWHSIQARLNDSSVMLDDEGLQLLEEPDLQYWLRRELFGARGTRLEAYRRAENRLRRFGL